TLDHSLKGAAALAKSGCRFEEVHIHLCHFPANVRRILCVETRKFPSCGSGYAVPAAGPGASWRVLLDKGPIVGTFPVRDMDCVSRSVLRIFSICLRLATDTDRLRRICRRHPRRSVDPLSQRCPPAFHLGHFLGSTSGILLSFPAPKR